MKSVVLLSGGLDSAVNLYKARRETDLVLALTFDYGQRAAVREIKAAKKLAENLSVPHKIVTIPWIKDFGRSSLLDQNLSLPQGDGVEIDSLEKSLQTAKSVWVPNRNGIFLNIAAGFAEALDATYVIPGFNLEEGQTFPDNTQGFLDSLTVSFNYSTANGVKAHCFTTALNKTEIVEMAISLSVPLVDIWPCYLPGEHWCGQCESCLRFKRALQVNNLNLDWKV